MADFAILLGLYLAFLNLAKRFKRSRWKTVIAGISVYVISHVFVGMIIQVYNTVNNYGRAAASGNSLSFQKLLVFVICIIIVYLFYTLLRKRFIQDHGNSPKNEIEKIGSGKY